MDRGSPGYRQKVLWIAGPLQPGHSGAPIFYAGRVVAIGSGGLNSGGTDANWAFPIESLRWSEASSLRRELGELRSRTVQGLFRMPVGGPEDEAPPVASVDSATPTESAPRSGLSASCSPLGKVGRTEWRSRYISNSGLPVGTWAVYVETLPFGDGEDQVRTNLDRWRSSFPEVDFAPIFTFDRVGGNRRWAIAVALGVPDGETAVAIQRFVRRCGISHDAYAYLWKGLTNSRPRGKDAP
jgi:hypothetical protein